MKTNLLCGADLLRRHGIAALAALGILFTATPLFAQVTTSFTYSGRLTQSNAPADGLFNMAVTLHSAETGNSPAGNPSTVFLSPVAITQGLFTIPLDFGPDAFNGELMWLELSIGPAGAPPAGNTVLTPRQPVRAVPQTTYARKAGTAVTATSAVTAQRAMVSDTADVATEAVVAQRARELAPGAYTEPVTFDHPANQFTGASAEFTGSVEAGGDLSGARLNIGTGHDLGGLGATIAGGENNSAGGAGSMIGGGGNNSAENAYATVGGGESNEGLGVYATVPGGRGNRALGSYSLAAGRRAKANHSGTFVWADSTDADFTSGAANQFLIRAAGGVGIGTSAPLHQLHIGLPAGLPTISFANKRCVIEDGTVSGRAAFLAVAGPIPSVGGQQRIEVQLEASDSNGGLGILGTVSGDPLEIRTGNLPRLTISTGGHLAVSDSSTMSFGATTRQMIDLWGSLYGIGVQSGTLYQRSAFEFSWHQGGSHSDAANSPGAGGLENMRLSSAGHLNVRGNVVANSVILSSDRAAKEHFQPVDPRSVLEKVVAMPLSEWNYKSDPSVRHLGPMAQDFHAAFGVGPDDRHIATVDADGVALAAIQGLNRKIEDELAEKSAEIAELKRTVAELKQTLETLGRNREGGVK